MTETMIPAPTEPPLPMASPSPHTYHQIFRVLHATGKMMESRNACLINVCAEAVCNDERDGRQRARVRSLQAKEIRQG
jgi:hypothetical protein